MVKYLITWNMQGATGEAKDGTKTDKYKLLEDQLRLHGCKNFVCCLQECGWPKGTWKFHDSHQCGINRIIEVYVNEHGWTLLLAPWSEDRHVDSMIQGKSLTDRDIAWLENTPLGSRCNVAVMSDLKIKDPYIILSSYLSGLEYRPMLTVLIDGIIFGSVHAMSGGGNDINQLMYSFVKWAYEKPLMSLQILSHKAAEHLEKASSLVINAHSNDHKNVDWQYSAHNAFQIMKHFLPENSIQKYYQMSDQYNSVLKNGSFDQAHDLRTEIVTHLNTQHNSFTKAHLEKELIFNRALSSTISSGASWYIAGDWNSSIHDVKNEHFIASKEKTVDNFRDSTDDFKKILVKVIESLHMLRLGKPTHNGEGELDYVLTNSPHPWQSQILIDKSRDVLDPSIKTSDHAALIFEFK